MLSKCGHIQLERNRSREALREHRIANRPALIGAKGMLNKDDKMKLGTHEVNEFIELEMLNPAGPEKVGDKIQAKPTIPIDPSVVRYRTLTTIIFA